MSGLVKDVKSVKGIEEVHDLHVWSITSNMYALSCHAERLEVSLDKENRVAAE